MVRKSFFKTGIAPLFNGSARMNVGKNSHEGGGGTEVMTAIKFEVGDVATGEGSDGGRINQCVRCRGACKYPSMLCAIEAEQCKASFSSAYPQLSSNVLDDLQYDYTTILH